MKRIILLTATVSPQITSRLTIRAVEERREQYRSAVALWREAAASTRCSLVIAENSGANPDDLVRSDGFSPRPTLLQAPSPDPSIVSRGKGAAEAALLDWSMQQVAPGDEDLVFKCTGRLFVRNFSQLSRSWRTGTSLLLDLPRARPVVWCDSRFFGGSGAAWSRNLTAMEPEIDDDADRVFENVLADRARAAAVEQPGSVLNFREAPWIVGRSGTSGRAYSSSRLKSAARPVVRLADRTRRRFALTL